MLEKPHISDETLIAAVHDHYGIIVTHLTFLPIGYDAFAAVYRAAAQDGETYFLKLKQGALYEASVQLPRFLKDHGMNQIAAPLTTQEGREWTALEEYTLILYPFIEGEKGANSVWSDAQWIEFGTAVRQLHSMQLPEALASQIRRETFSAGAKWEAAAPGIRAALDQSDLDPAARDLAAFWRAHEAEIDLVMARAAELGERVRQQERPFVLCHADIHVGNVMLHPDGRVFIVDWDQPIFAPKERDLVFIIGATLGHLTVGPRESDLFLQGYENRDIDPIVMAYYRYDWIVQDLVEFGEQVLLRDDSAAVKADATRILKTFFVAGSTIAAAHRFYEGL